MKSSNDIDIVQIRKDLIELFPDQSFVFCAAGIGPVTAGMTTHSFAHNLSDSEEGELLEKVFDFWKLRNPTLES